MKDNLRVIISGGGTGGHIFPAMAIAAAILRRFPKADILFVGAEGRMEMTRVPAAGYNIVGLPVAGFDRKRLWRNFGVALKLWKSMRKAKKIVREFRPDIAIGVGGYASGPTLKAAQQAGVPTLLQEQNSYPGVTNKMLSKNAKRICVAYPDLERFFPQEKIVMTGNPVRSNLADCPLSASEAKEKLDFDPEKPLVVLVGGSLGAHTLNEVMIDNALSGKVEKAGFQLLWQTGKRDFELCERAFAEKSPAGVKVVEFISDMGEAYRAADLIVSRAGASTISELELLGKASILVPSPNVAEDHQRKNAEALAKRNAAVMVLDKDASEKLWNTIEKLMGDSEGRRILAENVRKMAEEQSDERIVNEIVNILEK